MGIKHPTVLHAAVRRGSYTIFEYILKDCGFEDLVKEDEKFLDLIYKAVENTVHCDKIQDHVQIVKVLCDLNREMFNYSDGYHRTPLLAHRVNIQLLKTLIECGANLFHLDSDEDTILHKASFYLSASDYYDLLQCIPKTTLNSLLQMRNRDGEPSLHLIVKHGLVTTDILRLILSNGVDINTSGMFGYTCIFYALDMKYEDMTIPTVKLLLENGADHTRVNRYGYSVLHYSARKGRIDCLRFFLEEKNMNVNQINRYGDTPIFHALCYLESPLETVQFLLKRGADHKILNQDRSNLLHYAASKGELECLKLLLSLGGLDINQQNDDGDTPLSGALKGIDENMMETIRLLLANGADHRISAKHGNNVLHLLAKNGGKVECFHQFHGLPSLDVNARNLVDSNTPLHEVLKNFDNYYRFRRADDFNSLLHTIEALVELGADVNAKNSYGKTPLDIYQEKMLKSIFKEALLKNEITIRRLLEGEECESTPE